MGRGSGELTEAIDGYCDICHSPIFPGEGRVSNDLRRDRCRNCGLKKDDKRKKKPLRYEYIK